MCNTCRTGSGYTYLRNNALVRVTFGSHEIVQLDPELKDGERMVGYQISPDGKRLVFLANRGDDFWGSGRQVTIVNYRDRFAKAIEVSRHMPDDPWPEAFSSVYLYDLRGHDTEEGTLERVFTKRITGPRDILRVPEWSPDSGRVAFAAFEQSTGLIKILEAGFVDKDEEKDEKKEEDDKAEESAAAKDAKDIDKSEDRAKRPTARTELKSAAAEKKDEAQARLQDRERRGRLRVLPLRRAEHAGHGPPALSPRQPAPRVHHRALRLPPAPPARSSLRAAHPGHRGEVRGLPLPPDCRDHSTMFATSTEGDPNEEHVYAIDLETRR